MIAPRLRITVTRDQVTIVDLDSGATASAGAPFSCSHLVVDDVGIFEHAARQALLQVVRGGWKFPKAEVTTPGHRAHGIERKAITDGLLNAGLSKVALVDDVACDERQTERRAYIDQARRTR